MLNQLSIARVISMCAWLWVAACAASEHDPVPQAQTQRPQIPNPAAQKCVEDGYQLEPVLDKGGVPIDHDCVDKGSGKRCEVWQYFRGTCRLPEAPQH